MSSLGYRITRTTLWEDAGVPWKVTGPGAIATLEKGREPLYELCRINQSEAWQHMETDKNADRD